MHNLTAGIYPVTPFGKGKKKRKRLGLPWSRVRDARRPRMVGKFQSLKKKKKNEETPREKGKKRK